MFISAAIVEIEPFVTHVTKMGATVKLHLNFTNTHTYLAALILLFSILTKLFFVYKPLICL